MVGDGEVLFDQDAPGPVALGAGGAARASATGGASTPGGPQHGVGVVAGLLAGVVADEHIALVDVGDDRAHVLLDAQLSRVLAAFCDSFGPNMASGALPPSNSRTRASSGSMLRNSARRVLVATSLICPASSTPVGPAPTRANVS